MATVSEPRPRKPLPGPEPRSPKKSNEHAHSEFEEPISAAYKFTLISMMVFPLLGMLFAIITAWQFGWMSWLNLTMLIGGWYLGGLGITIGFHRMLTHRSFETTGPIRFFWVGLGTLALEGSPLDWCMVHRKHHRFSDHHGDPHSPSLHGEGWLNKIKGFWNSHIGWMFVKNWDRSERTRYIPDLVNDPLLVAIDKNYKWWAVATFVLPLIIGGLATWTIQGAILGFIWGGLARVCLTHHMTWSINSICHIIGRQDYKSSDDSRNNLFFGYLSHGEGWHNNHHAFPNSAKHGLKWWQFDLSWTIIRGLELCGLAWNVKLPSKKQLAAKALD